MISEDSFILKIISESHYLTADQLHVLKQESRIRGQSLQHLLQEFGWLSPQQWRFLFGQDGVDYRTLPIPSNPLVWHESDLTSFSREMNTPSLSHQEQADILQALLGQAEIDAESQVIPWVEMLLQEAIEWRVSDIHLEPSSGFITLRYRIDGLLQKRLVMHQKFWSSLAVRLKLMAQLNIAESKKPQNGRIRFPYGDRVVDLRVATHPTLHGENMVIRVLDQNALTFALQDLGYSTDTLAVLEDLIREPEGLVLITGPTGSGKTTSLYAMLAQLSSETQNIMTLEDPIEYQLPGIRQTTIQESIGWTFSEGVRSLLRQDPDVILLGEIRDEDTAHMALRACMAGNKVFSTVHARNALGAIYRFIDFHVPSALLVTNLSGMVAQRLLRSLCAACKSPELLSQQHQRLFVQYNLEPQAWKAVGCSVCQGTGYKNRFVLAEAIRMDSILEKLLLQSTYHPDIDTYLISQEFKTLKQQGCWAISQGKTSVAEFQRVLGKLE